MLQTLRQPRYAALSLLMLAVAIACVLAGTWQIIRYEGKAGQNDDLRANAQIGAAPVTNVLPLVDDGDAPAREAVELRQVQASGFYQPDRQVLLRRVSLDGKNGFHVVTPLRTTDSTLLVVRGFVPMTNAGTAPAEIPLPPQDRVTITARAQPGATSTDNFGRLPIGQVDSINPRLQSVRLGTAVHNGYVQLEAGQPGTRGLTAIPVPDLSNPAGGALEPQHLAYVAQWYIFAALALAAPFVMARAESHQQQHGNFDAEPGQPRTAAEARAAKLAQRYGRAQAGGS